jgi:hypothetical protein
MLPMLAQDEEADSDAEWVKIAMMAGQAKRPGRKPKQGGDDILDAMPGKRTYDKLYQTGAAKTWISHPPNGMMPW